MKKLALFAAALVLTFGLAQCKKEQTQTEGKTVQITVKVANSGSKANVDPSNGHITFNDGDKLYVGYNSACVGTLTYSGSAFSGSVSDAVVGTQPLHFYYLGGAAATVVDATHYSADISDQSSNYPVISYGTSTTDYTGSGSYETTLLNQCGLVKFNLATGTDASVSVGGLYTKATIDFANPGVVTPGTTGSITLHEGASNTERWAILLPQAGVTATATISGYTCSISSFPDVAINDYNTTGVDIAMTPAWDGDLANITPESTEAFATATDGMTITGTLTVNKKISIADGATVTLSGVTINGTNSGSYSWAGLNCLGDATIVLADGTTNTVKGFHEDYPGIHVPNGKTLTIQGTGTLNASSNGFGAGIGGGLNIDCGNIIINSGTITATGGQDAAGIGSAKKSSCGTITISGGTVTANGGPYSAGIGSGGANSAFSSCSSSCGTITISGGTVEASGGQSGAGIGSGDGSNSGSSSCDGITISGGEVTATGGQDAAGIGSGKGYGGSSSCENITISGGTVEAGGGNYGAGIGSGRSASCSDITIASTVTRVTATKSSFSPYSIGVGSNGGTCGTVTIGGTVYYNGSSYQNGGDTYLAQATIVYPVPSFTINGSGTKVVFAPGNLQATYDGSSWNWAFATNQWDYIGYAEGNTKVSGSAPFVSGYSGTSTTVDLFGWVGSSSNFTGAAQYGISNSTTTNDANGYGKKASEALKSDWGNTIGSGWRTLSIAEWQYVFGTNEGDKRPGSTVNGTSNARYTEATINTDGTGVNGMILFPDGVTITNGEATSWGNINNTSAWGTQCTTAQWAALAVKGCVFLPAAGNRHGTSVFFAGSFGFYRSSSPNTSNVNNACSVIFGSSNLNPSNSSNSRCEGYSVRLVKDAD